MDDWMEDDDFLSIIYCKYFIIFINRRIQSLRILNKMLKNN